MQSFLQYPIPLCVVVEYLTFAPHGGQRIQCLSNMTMKLSSRSFYSLSEWLAALVKLEGVNFKARVSLLDCALVVPVFGPISAQLKVTFGAIIQVLAKCLHLPGTWTNDLYKWFWSEGLPSSFSDLQLCTKLLGHSCCTMLAQRRYHLCQSQSLTGS